MREQLERRLRELARRAGVAGAPTAVLWAAVALVALAVALAAWKWWPREATDTAGFSSAGGSGGRAGAVAAGAAASAGASDGASPGSGSTEGSTSAPLWVHVVGAVRSPGVFSLPSGSRVEAAIQAAGGLTAGAAPEGVNLARRVEDGEQIAVPTRDELASGGIPGAGAAGGAGGAGAAGGTSSRGSAGSGAGVSAGGGAKVNINSADATQLDALPGVGASTAAKIVADREANGPFKSADDLGRVSGIGPKKLETLKPLLSVH
jgi:competence protein ComEA